MLGDVDRGSGGSSAAARRKLGDVDRGSGGSSATSTAGPAASSATSTAAPSVAGLFRGPSALCGPVLSVSGVRGPD